MKTLTAPATIRAQRPYAAPLYLLQLDFASPSALTLYLSDRYIAAAMSHEWLPFVLTWGTLEEALNSLDVDGRPATAEITLVNTQPIAGRARLSDLIRTPGNTGTAYEWAFAKATVYQRFADVGDGDEIRLGVFYLEEPIEIGNSQLSLRMSDQSLVLEDTLRVNRVTRADFPTCAPSRIGQTIRRPFGVLTNVPAIPLVDAAADQLNGKISNAVATITLKDASLFSLVGSGQIRDEQFSWTSKSGNDLTGCSRGINSTVADYHPDGAHVFEVKTGANVYRYVVGEGLPQFPIKAITNIRQNGSPTTVPSVEVDATDIVSGRHFGAISYSVTHAKTFHQVPPTPALPAASNLPCAINQTVDSTGNSTWAFTVTPTLVAPPFPFQFSGAVHRHVVMTWAVISGSFSVSGTNTIRRRDPNTGSFVTMQTDNAGPALNFTNATYDYDTGDSVGDELWQVNLSGDGDGFHFTFTITAYTLTSDTMEWAGLSSRTGDSTAQIVIGDVTCDVEGIQDDASGQFTGSALALLENPTDVTRCILTQLYGVASADLGATWGVTRAAHAAAGYKWATLLDYALFSQLRRKLGEQARSVLTLESGVWQYHFLADAPAAQKTLDYARDVWDQNPAVVRRSPRTDLRNSLNVSARMDYATGDYRYLTVQEDLATYATPARAELQLDLVQDTATADALGAYWLGVWKRLRFLVTLTAWQNILEMDKVDYLAISGHPVLDGHGGTALVFRIVGKSYLVSDANPNRIRLELTEA